MAGRDGQISQRYGLWHGFEKLAYYDGRWLANDSEEMKIIHHIITRRHGRRKVGKK